MMRSGVSRSTVLVAGLVALIYGSLAAIAATCAFSHLESSDRHAHHDSHEATPHNALCAWACQATSDAGLAPEPPAVSMSPVVQPAVLSLNHAIPSHSSSPLRSRAPPSAPFAHIG
jgi:hypothetical protein